MRIRAIQAISCVAAVAALAGCGHSGKKSSSTTTTATATTTATSTTKRNSLVVEGFHVLAIVEFHEREYTIEPKSIGFQVPGYFGIRAINDGKVAHALSISGQGLERSTGTIQPGNSKTIAVWFKKPGLYKVFCPIDGHEQRGMTAVIRVR